MYKIENTTLLRKKFRNIEQLIVRIGKGCNFNCIFCNIANNESKINKYPKIENIISRFHKKFKKSNIINSKLIVAISGGEPSIYKKETIIIVSYIKKYLEKKNIEVLFQIQTNASFITYEFATKLKTLGVKIALISFHTNQKDTFEDLMKVPYNDNIKKIEEGIKILNEVGFLVDINIVLFRQNTKELFDLVKYLYSNYPFIGIFNFGIVQPHGKALNNKKSLVPAYSEIYKEYNKVLYFLYSKNKEVISHFTGLPFCYLNKLNFSLEVRENLGFKNNESDIINLINKINDSNKVHLSACKKCLYNNICSGIWKEYRNIQELNAIYYVKDFFMDFESNSYASKINSLNKEEINKLYTKGIRQILLSFKDFDKEALTKTLKYLNNKNFYKKSILINRGVKFDKTFLDLKKYIDNIQVFIESIDIITLKEIIFWNKKVPFQFRINIDIYVYNYKKEIKEKIYKIINLIDLNENFCFIYFIYNHNINNNDILKYKSFFSSLKDKGLIENNDLLINTINFYKPLLANDLIANRL